MCLEAKAGSSKGVASPASRRSEPTPCPPRTRIVFTVLACIVALGGSVVFLHSDGRADWICDEAGFFAGGHLSLWPPGAACCYGEPTSTAVRLNPLMFFSVFAVVVIVAALWPLARRTQPVA